MDEILASIRRIIAEDPPREIPGPSPAAAEANPGSLSARLHDVFGGTGSPSHGRSAGPVILPSIGEAARNAIDEDLADLVAAPAFSIPPPPPPPPVTVASPPVVKPALIDAPASPFSLVPGGRGPLGSPPPQGFARSQQASPASGVEPPAGMTPVLGADSPATAEGARPRSAERVVIAAMAPKFHSNGVLPSTQEAKSLSRAEAADEERSALMSGPSFDLSSLPAANPAAAGLPPRPVPVLRVEVSKGSKADPEPQPDPKDGAAWNPVGAGAAKTGTAETETAKTGSAGVQERSLGPVAGRLAQVAEHLAAGIAAQTPALATGGKSESATAGEAASIGPIGGDVESRPDGAAPEPLAEGTGASTTGLAEAPNGAAVQPMTGGLPSFSALPAGSAELPASDRIEPASAAIADTGEVPADPQDADDAETYEAVPRLVLPELPQMPSSGMVAFGAKTALEPVMTGEFEDTAAELLRPMLRQWLDSNMPRIVEKALRRELTERPPVAKALEAPSDGDDPII